jgi:hypothetical protein
LLEALKTLYHDIGWNTSGKSREESACLWGIRDIPAAEAKPEQNLLIRLDELKDYRFFDDAAIIPCPLWTAPYPC